MQFIGNKEILSMSIGENNISSFSIGNNIVYDGGGEPEVLPFKFNGNTLTGYTGTSTSVVIPSSYSIGESTEITVNGILFDTSFELEELSYSLSNFKSITFKDKITLSSKKYKDSRALQNLTVDFPDGAYLSNAVFYDTLSAEELGMTLDMLNKFPILCNNNNIENSLAYNNYIETLGYDITLSFSGTLLEQSYITGNDYSVTAIGDRVFSDLDVNITSLVIPNSITTIGEYAFLDCRNLTSIVLGTGIVTIKLGAFSGCYNLASNINIPSSTTTIESWAFHECKKFTSLTIGSGVTYIEDDAFSGCSALATITVDENNSIYYSEGNCIIRRADKRLIVGCKNSVIPNDIMSIAGYAFNACTSLTSVIIPDSVVDIGDSAFFWCTGLTSITIMSLIPPTVTANSFLYTNNCPIYVPSESITDYQTDVYWASYSSRLQTI